MANIFKTRKSNLGFKNTSNFLASLTQKSLEKKGFSQSKLIMNWNEIVGLELSKHAKPLKISFPKNGLGATLIVEIDGAFGPEIDLQRDTIKEKVNRVYGYTAISKITFRTSPFMGYDVKLKEELFKVNNSQVLQVPKVSMIGENLRKSILNLENTKNQELRESLKQLSSNFLKHPSIEL